MCSGGGPTLLKVVTAKSMNYFFQDWHRHETSLIKIVLSPPSFTLNNSFFLFLSSVSTKSIIYIYFFINPNNSFFRSQPTLQICTTTYLVIIPHVPAGCSKIQMKVWREKTLEAVLLLCMMFLSSSVQPQELFFSSRKESRGSRWGECYIDKRKLCTAEEEQKTEHFDFSKAWFFLLCNISIQTVLL